MRTLTRPLKEASSLVWLQKYQQQKNFLQFVNYKDFQALDLFVCKIASVKSIFKIQKKLYNAFNTQITQIQSSPDLIYYESSNWSLTQITI